MSPDDDIRTSLDKLAKAADAQGREKIAAVCLLAIAKIDELEADLLIRHGQPGGLARAEQLSPERRHDIAVTAARRRWGRRRAS